MRADDDRGDDAHLIETRVSSQPVYEGKLLHVRRDTVRLPDGSLATREYIVHPGAVLVVPVLPDGRLVIERQYRYPLQQVFVEFPAGKLDPGESALATGVSASSRRRPATRPRLDASRRHPSAALVLDRGDRDLRCPQGSSTSARSSTTASSSRSAA